MTDDNRLISAKAADNFTTESPVRAFTDFQVSGHYAIGKGFRPSLAHLARYLDAMETREGWRLVQIILPDDDAGDPTILFHKVPSLKLVMHGAAPPPAERAIFEHVAANSGAIEAALSDDPVNPKHYGGTKCAEIGERLSANSYQILKYNWRLGEKDEERIELGKALWYLEREMGLACEGWRPIMLEQPMERHMRTLLAGQPEWTQIIAKLLLSWNRYGNVQTLIGLRKTIKAHKAFGGAGEGITTGLAV